jgi:mRNA interferase MazF
VGFPLTLELSNPELPKQSRVKISQIRTLSAERLGKKLTKVSAEELNLIIEGFNEIIGG